MKKYISIILASMCALSLIACGGDVSDVKILECQSEIYTDEDIKEAIEVTKNILKKSFQAVHLLKSDMQETKNH